MSFSQMSFSALFGHARDRIYDLKSSFFTTEQMSLLTPGEKMWENVMIPHQESSRFSGKFYKLTRIPVSDHETHF